MEDINKRAEIIKQKLQQIANKLEINDKIVWYFCYVVAISQKLFHPI